MTQPATRALEVEVRVEARPETVFSYFADPVKCRQWLGVDAELDPRPGGLFRATLTGRTRAAVRGTYVAVEPPRRVVYTWGWEEPLMMPVLKQVPPGSSTVEITLVPDGEATIVRVRHSGLPSEDAIGFHSMGWRSSLARLQAVVAGRDPGPHPFADV
jgi:uncharacterized protein YndB with AHSA1/START domain